MVSLTIRVALHWESLELRRIRSGGSAKEIVAKARAKSRLSSDRAMALAVDQTRLTRKGRLEGIPARGNKGP